MAYTYSGRSASKVRMQGAVQGAEVHTPAKVLVRASYTREGSCARVLQWRCVHKKLPFALCCRFDDSVQILSFWYPVFSYIEYVNPSLLHRVLQPRLYYIEYFNVFITLSTSTRTVTHTYVHTHTHHTYAHTHTQARAHTHFTICTCRTRTRALMQTLTPCTLPHLQIRVQFIVGVIASAVSLYRRGSLFDALWRKLKKLVSYKTKTTGPSIIFS